jgi:hypothetical protein
LIALFRSISCCFVFKVPTFCEVLNTVEFLIFDADVEIFQFRVSMTYLLHSIETKNVQQEDSEAGRQPCGQGSSEPQLKKRKASTHLVVDVHNATALLPIHLGSNAYLGVWGSQPPNWVPPAGSWMAPQGGPWMPQQGGGWMVSGPQHMQPAAMVEAPIQAHLTPDSAARGSCRHKRKVLDDAV